MDAGKLTCGTGFQLVEVRNTVAPVSNRWSQPAVFSPRRVARARVPLGACHPVLERGMNLTS